MSGSGCGPFGVRVSVPVAPPAVRVPVPAEPALIRVPVPGPMGAQGVPGPPGPGLSTTVIVQAEPAAVWTLQHGLQRYPSVTLVDDAGDVFGASLRYPDANTVVVTLNAPTAGIAYLN